MIIKPTVKKIFEQLNRMLAEKAAQGQIIEHNLEKGLGAERALRELLKDFLPKRFAVAKGKIVNFAGEMSQHCGILIYDGLNCPKLFIDENENQIIPIEGVYAVLEVKTTLTKHTLAEAFQNLHSVYALQTERPIRSLNPKVDHRPPCLVVVGFKGVQLATLHTHFQEFNRKYPVTASFSAFSSKSPGYVDLTDETFLVHKVACLDKGAIHHMYTGEIAIRPWGEYTLGMLLTSLLADIEQIPAATVNIRAYFNYMMIKDPEFFQRPIELL